MKLYHTDGNIEIFHGDLVDLLNHPIMHCRRPNVIFSDPPFNVGKDYGEDKDKRYDYYYWCDWWIQAAWSCLHEEGSFYLMTIGRHLGKLYPMMHQKGVFVNHISWINTANGNFPKSHRPDAQPILFYAKSKNYYFLKHAEAGINRVQRWDNRSTTGPGEMKDTWDDIPFVYTGSIKHNEAALKPGSNSKVHPAQMPEALARRILAFSCPPGGLVMDLFMGSGTMAKVAKDMGLSYVGIDLNEDFCALAKERLSTAGPAKKVIVGDTIFEQGKLDI